MPPRKAPTARQQRLGTELRKMREHAGLSSNEAAAMVRTDRTTMSGIEAGRIGVSEERVRTLATVYQESDEAYVNALVAMAEERHRGWWEEYRDTLGASALDLAELEHHSVSFRYLQITHIPGLAQTEDYARAVFSHAVPRLSPQALRQRLSHRLRRRDVLDRAPAPDCVFMIHEAALRMQFGGPKVAGAQLDYLLDVAERDNVDVRVIPFSAGGFPNAGTSVVYARGPVEQLDTIHLDLPMGGTFIDSEITLKNYRTILDEAHELSLDPAASREFISGIAKQL
ncbi:helix-turn-helix transcriptional regulator [Streptomyces sp. NPDC001941]|uniref:helix-turn-helix domain-containing protein n=1 Tax=Streptomyces sp. NPDC001941 TaxID=3154659 RepID=UPI0033285A67